MAKLAVYFNKFGVSNALQEEWMALKAGLSLYMFVALNSVLLADNETRARSVFFRSLAKFFFIHVRFRLQSFAGSRSVKKQVVKKEAKT